jgi:hypothetical protein
MQKEQNRDKTDKIQHNITQKKFYIKYKHVMQSPYNKTVEEKKKKTFSCIVSHF